MIVSKSPSPHRLLGLLLAPLGLIASAASAQSLGACSSFYGSDFALAQGKLNPTMPTLAEPAKGTVYSEPNFKTCVARATDHSKEGLSTFARNDYSRRQAFNADNTRFIVYSNDGWWHQYNANTLAYIGKLSPRVSNPSVAAQYHMAGDAEPQWHPTDPNILYYLPTNGGTKLLALDVRTNTHSVAADFAGKLPSWASGAAHIWTKSEGSPSADGRYWGFQVENSNFGLLGYMVWDLQQNRLVGSYQSSSRPDHSSMSAAGRWYITSSDTTGTWAWSPDFTKKKKLHAKSEHSDLALGPNGEDYYVSVDYQSSAGDVFYTDIDACPAVDASATTAPVCPRTVLFTTYINGAATAMHFSGKAFKRPGWLVWSTYSATQSRDGSWPWYTAKIFAIELKANPRVYPLAYTRNGGGGYWAEPHATVSRDLTRIAFNSNWGVSGDDIDDYIIHIPASALPGSKVTGGNNPARRVSTGTSASQTSSAQQAVKVATPTAASASATPATATTPSVQTPSVDVSNGIRVGNPRAQRLARLAWIKADSLVSALKPYGRNAFSTTLSLPGFAWVWVNERFELDPEE